ncbi:hypothetical protein A2U01_0101475, partial [Trifolium medium]|nr:hypothetical protein [Trifolium medium]
KTLSLNDAVMVFSVLSGDDGLVAISGDVDRKRECYV